MKKLLLLSIAVNLLLLSVGIKFFFDKGGFRVFGESNSLSYLEGRAQTFKNLNETPDNIVFLGDSLTEGGEWSEMFKNANLVNRGINGETTEGVLNRIEETVDGKPEKLFLMIGINDLEHKVPVSDIIENYENILKTSIGVSPNTKLYVQSVLPNNSDIRAASVPTDEINELNSQIKELAEEYGAKYLNVFESMVDKDGNLNKDFTYDGVHLKQPGYEAWMKNIESAVLE